MVFNWQCSVEMIVGYSIKNIVIILWKTLVPLIFCWKLCHSCLCLEMWRDVTPCRNTTAFFFAVLQVNKLTKRSQGRKEENKNMIVFMPWLWTSHLLLSFNIQLHENAYICAECIQNEIVCDLLYTNYLSQHLLITPVKRYRMGNSVISS